MNPVTADERFEQRVSRVVLRANRTAECGNGGATQDPPAENKLVPAGPEQELANALGLGYDELELVWSVVAHAVEPRVVAASRLQFGADGRDGVALGHHIA